MHIASILTAAQTIEIVDRDLALRVPENHVRLRLATASICGTDMHYYRHFQNAGFVLKRPVTLGHEACGYVVDANGSGLRVGQLVALNPIIRCGTCSHCREGQENLCVRKQFPGSATTVPHIDGFFQAQFDFPARCCHPVPNGVDPDRLTFAEPLACSMHAVRVAGLGSGKRVLVTGCGPMGLLALIAARAVGAEVDVSDVRPGPVALARTIGASNGFVTGVDDIPVLAYDAVIEASGSPYAFNQALEAIKRQARIVILSSIQSTATPINLHRIMLKEIQVLGSFQFNSEFVEAVNLVQMAGGQFDPLIAGRYGLEDTGVALEKAVSGGLSGKILIKQEA